MGEPNEATCWNHWTRESELTSILDSPVCGQDFFVQLAVGVTECPLGYGYVTTNEECQAARTELQITRWNDEDNKSARAGKQISIQLETLELIFLSQTRPLFANLNCP